MRGQAWDEEGAAEGRQPTEKLGCSLLREQFFRLLSHLFDQSVSSSVIGTEAGQMPRGAQQQLRSEYSFFPVTVHRLRVLGRPLACASGRRGIIQDAAVEHTAAVANHLQHVVQQTVVNG